MSGELAWPVPICAIHHIVALHCPRATVSLSSVFRMSKMSPRPRRAGLLSSEALDRSRVLDTLVNNLQGMAYRCLNDRHWKMILVSEGARELCGYGSAELVEGSTTSWEGLTGPEDRQRVRAVIQESVHSGRRTGGLRGIHKRSGGGSARRDGRQFPHALLPSGVGAAPRRSVSAGWGLPNQ